MYLFLERREGGERGKHECGRETLISCLLQTPPLGMEPATQARALDSH